MRNALLGFLSAAVLTISANAQTEAFLGDKDIAKSSGTVRIVVISSSAFTLLETSTNVAAAYGGFVLLPGSDHAVLQSTHAGGQFCCSFEADGSTSIVSGAKGCLQAEKENGGGFYKMEVKRWWQNLRLYCLSLANNAPIALRLGQTK